MDECSVIGKNASGDKSNCSRENECTLFFVFIRIYTHSGCDFFFYFIYSEPNSRIVFFFLSTFQVNDQNCSNVLKKNNFHPARLHKEAR